MYQSFFDYAQSQRKELSRLASIRGRALQALGRDPHPGTQLRDRVANSLISLGTRLKAQAPTAAGKFATRQQSPRWSQ